MGYTRLADQGRLSDELLVGGVPDEVGVGAPTADRDALGGHRRGLLQGGQDAVQPRRSLRQPLDLVPHGLRQGCGGAE